MDLGRFGEENKEIDIIAEFCESEMHSPLTVSN